MVRTLPFAVVSFVSCLATPTLPAQDTDRLSLDAKGQDADAACRATQRAATAGGASGFVVFTSGATDLVANDTNLRSDVFLRDLATKSTSRIVFDAKGGEPDGDCTTASITADGRYVLFESWASDLVAGDAGFDTDVFLLDRQKGAIERVSIADDEAEPNLDAFPGMVSEDGNVVVFESRSTNLVPGIATGTMQVYLRDRGAGSTICLSVDPSGAPGLGNSVAAAMTADGEHVVFASTSPNLVPNDTNSRQDVFLRDVAAGITTRVSVNDGGFQLDQDSGEPSLSPDGSLLLFTSSATNLHRDVTTATKHAYVRDLATGVVRLASRGLDGRPIDATPIHAMLGFHDDGAGGEPLVAFWSQATNLPDDGGSDLDAFVVRLDRGAIQCVSLASDGTEPPPSSGSFGRIGFSPEGDAVVYTTDFDGLDAADANGLDDVFRRGLQWTLLEEFGDGLAGSGGHVPHLGGRGGSCEAGRWSVTIDDGFPQAPGTLWVGFGRTNGAKLFGGTFHVDLAQPFLALPIVLGGPPGISGAGTLHFDGVNVEGLGEFSLYLQCTFVDARAVRGVSISNALEIAIDA